MLRTYATVYLGEDIAEISNAGFFFSCNSGILVQLQEVIQVKLKIRFTNQSLTLSSGIQYYQ